MKIISKLISLLLILSLLSCTSAPRVSQSVQTQTQTQQQAAPQPVQTASTYWSGDGGKGMSIAILSPRTSGLAEDQDYLPALVQGEFVSNFSGFSAISVLDRERLDDQYAELLSGYYDDNAQAGLDLGHLTPTTHIMGGNITKTATGYALQMQITKSDDKITTASYSGTFTFAELDDLTGIRRASLDLLQKMGITLTTQARNELAGAAAENHVNAQTALARGISAQRQGTEVAALSYYFQAAALDASLLEASNRSSVMSTNISSGNIGADTRNDIEWRRQWVARLTETEQYFNNVFNTTSIPYTLFYSTGIIAGAINYQTETRTISINTNLHATGSWIWLSSVERALQAVYDGLEATGRKQVWGLQSWPWQGVTNLKLFERKRASFSIVAELLNSNEKIIGRANFQSEGTWSFNGYGRPQIQVSNDDRKQVSFTNVRADDITDSLTIRITSVNGVNAQTVAQTGVLQTKAISGGEWSDYISFTMNRNEITEYNGRNSFVVIPSIWDEPVLTIRKAIFQYNNVTGITIIGNNLVSIGPDVFANSQLTSVNIGNNVTSIGANAFSGNRLTIITIPNSVTSIGDMAFADNQLTNVTIPNSVTSIGNKAFADNRLTNVTIPNSVVSIGNSAFSGNQLTSITIPNSVTSIGDWAFENNKLTSVHIGNRVTSIGYSAFSDNQLTTITIPSNVTNIESKAFANNQLTIITIGANVSLHGDPFDDLFQYSYVNKIAGTYYNFSNAWYYGETNAAAMDAYESAMDAYESAREANREANMKASVKGFLVDSLLGLIFLGVLGGVALLSGGLTSLLD